MSLVPVISGGYSLTDAALLKLFGPGLDLIDNLYETPLGVRSSVEYIASVRFRATENAPFASIKNYWSAGSGYSAGDGGSQVIAIYPDDGTSDHRPNMAGSPLATLTYLPASNGMSGGKYPDAGTWPGSPTYSPGSQGFFDNAFGSSANAVAGTLYHAVCINTAASPATNWSTWDSAAVFTQNGPPHPYLSPVDWGILVGSRTAGGGGAYTWADRSITPYNGTLWSPICQITYGNGKKQGFAGAIETGNQTPATGGPYLYSINGSQYHQEVFAIGADFLLGGVQLQTAASVAGTLTCQLIQNGSVIASKAVTRTVANYVAINPAGFPNLPRGQYAFEDFDFGSPGVSIAAGTLIVRWVPTSGTWQFTGQRNGSTRGFVSPTIPASYAQVFDGTTLRDQYFWDHSATGTQDGNWRVILHKAGTDVVTPPTTPTAPTKRFLATIADSIGQGTNPSGGVNEAQYVSFRGPCFAALRLGGLDVTAIGTRVTPTRDNLEPTGLHNAQGGALIDRVLYNPVTNPGAAQISGSGLADELKAANPTGQYDGWIINFTMGYNDWNQGLYSDAQAADVTGRYSAMVSRLETTLFPGARVAMGFVRSRFLDDRQNAAMYAVIGTLAAAKASRIDLRLQDVALDVSDYWDGGVHLAKSGSVKVGNQMAARILGAIATETTAPPVDTSYTPNCTVEPASVRMRIAVLGNNGWSSASQAQISQMLIDLAGPSGVACDFEQGGSVKGTLTFTGQLTISNGQAVLTTLPSSISALQALNLSAPAWFVVRAVNGKFLLRCSLAASNAGAILTGNLLPGVAIAIQAIKIGKDITGAPTGGGGSGGSGGGGTGSSIWTRERVLAKMQSDMLVNGLTTNQKTLKGTSILVANSFGSVVNLSSGPSYIASGHGGILYFTYWLWLTRGAPDNAPQSVMHVYNGQVLLKVGGTWYVVNVSRPDGVEEIPDAIGGGFTGLPAQTYLDASTSIVNPRNGYMYELWSIPFAVPIAPYALANVQAVVAAVQVEMVGPDKASSFGIGQLGIDARGPGDFQGAVSANWSQIRTDAPELLTCSTIWPIRNDNQFGNGSGLPPALGGNWSQTNPYSLPPFATSVSDLAANMPTLVLR